MSSAPNIPEPAAADAAPDASGGQVPSCWKNAAATATAADAESHAGRHHVAPSDADNWSISRRRAAKQGKPNAQRLGNHTLAPRRKLMQEPKGRNQRRSARLEPLPPVDEEALFAGRFNCPECRSGFRVEPGTPSKTLCLQKVLHANKKSLCFCAYCKKPIEYSLTCSMCPQFIGPVEYEKYETSLRRKREADNPSALSTSFCSPAERKRKASGKPAPPSTQLQHQQHQRRKKNQEQNEKEETLPSTSVLDLPKDCRLIILSFLGQHDDLPGTYGIASKTCLDDVRDDTLPQTRTATIKVVNGPGRWVKKKGNDHQSFVREKKDVNNIVALIERKKDHTVWRHKVRLKIAGHQLLHRSDTGIAQANILSAMTAQQVESLDLSFPEGRNKHDCNMPLEMLELGLHLPHVFELDLSRAVLKHCYGIRISNIFASFRQSLTVLRWNGCVASNFFMLSGDDLRGFPFLSELQLNNSVLASDKDVEVADMSEESQPVCLLRCLHKQLVKVSIRGARCWDCRRGEIKRIPQQELAKFVRSAKKLRWFQSDLSLSNTDALKVERPDVSFCS